MICKKKICSCYSHDQKIACNTKSVQQIAQNSYKYQLCLNKTIFISLVLYAFKCIKSSVV